MDNERRIAQQLLAVGLWAAMAAPLAVTFVAVRTVQGLVWPRH